MNDRFKFRTPIYGADGKFKKFVYWNAENGFPAITCRKGDVFKDPEQCTGLKDNKGQLIYEGDIVNILCEVEEQGVIEWATEEAQFVVSAEQAGFDECLRVLKPYGTLVFKWNETQIKLSEVLRIFGVRPLFGHRRGKTHFLVFMKFKEEARNAVH